MHLHSRLYHSHNQCWRLWDQHPYLPLPWQQRLHRPKMTLWMLLTQYQVVPLWLSLAASQWHMMPWGRLNLRAQSQFQTLQVRSHRWWSVNVVWLTGLVTLQHDHQLWAYCRPPPAAARRRVLSIVRRRECDLASWLTSLRDLSYRRPMNLSRSVA